MNLQERFEARIEKRADGCWIISGHRTKGGYVQMRVDGKVHYAHRLSFALYRDEIPDGLFVCHHCDVPNCVNPDHLFLGTAADNMADKVAKGRQPRGAAHGRSKLSEDDARYILRSKLGSAELSRLYHITIQSVCDIRKGKNWAHLHV